MSDHRIDLSALAKKFDGGGHSIFSPSGSAMWSACSGSLIPNLLQPDTAGIEAAYGTVGHSVGEIWAKTHSKPAYLIGTVERIVEGDQVFEITIDETMLEYVQVYYDWVACLPGDHFVETRVDFSDLTPIPNQSGTADHCACSPGKLVLTDLKMGVGVKVYAEWNSQLLIYAYGFFREYDFWYDFQEIELRICQPRLDHLDTFTVTRQQLLDFAEHIRERAAAAWALDAPRSPSEKGCQWCKVKRDCGAHAAMVVRMSDGVFDNLDAPVTSAEVAAVKDGLDFGVPVNFTPAAQLSVADLAAIYRFKGVTEKWLAEVGERLKQLLKEGVDVPGYKLVQGKSSRSFPNQKAATEHLQFLGLTFDEIAPRQMVSPAQAEDLLLKQGYKRKMLPSLLNDVVQRAPGAPTMVPSTDKRPSLLESSEGVFDDLDGE